MGDTVERAAVLSIIESERANWDDVRPLDGVAYGVKRLPTGPASSSAEVEVLELVRSRIAGAKRNASEGSYTLGPGEYRDGFVESLAIVDRILTEARARQPQPAPEAEAGEVKALLREAHEACEESRRQQLRELRELRAKLEQAEAARAEAERGQDIVNDAIVAAREGLGLDVSKPFADQVRQMRAKYDAAIALVQMHKADAYQERERGVLVVRERDEARARQPQPADPCQQPAKARCPLCGGEDLAEADLDGVMFDCRRCGTVRVRQPAPEAEAGEVVALLEAWDKAKLTTPSLAVVQFATKAIDALRASEAALAKFDRQLGSTAATRSDAIEALSAEAGQVRAKLEQAEERAAKAERNASALFDEAKRAQAEAFEANKRAEQAEAALPVARERSAAALSELDAAWKAAAVPARGMVDLSEVVESLRAKRDELAADLEHEKSEHAITISLHENASEDLEKAQRKLAEAEAARAEAEKRLAALDVAVPVDAEVLVRIWWEAAWREHPNPISWDRADEKSKEECRSEARAIVQHLARAMRWAVSIYRTEESGRCSRCGVGRPGVPASESAGWLCFDCRPDRAADVEAAARELLAALDGPHVTCCACNAVAAVYDPNDDPAEPYCRNCIGNEADGWKPLPIEKARMRLGAALGGGGGDDNG